MKPLYQEFSTKGVKPAKRLCYAMAFVALFAVLAPAAVVDASSPFVLIVDPAHGGKDRGIQSTLYDQKTSEAHVALRFAREVLKVAQTSFSDAMTAKLTRQDNYSVDPTFRTGFANEQKGSFFFSIHCAKSPDPLKRGITFYYPPQSPQNQATPPPQSGPPITWQTVESPDPALLDQSRLLAQALGKALSSSIPTRVLEARLDEFVGLTMPSVAVEIGYVTNSLDREMLKNQDSRTKLITLLLTGIRDFQKTNGHDRTTN